LEVFIVATLADLATGICLIGDRQFLFSSTYILKSNFMHVAGLINGAEVRVGGIHKGTVKQIQLPVQPDGGVTVVMAMEKSTRKVIRKDSVASIQTEGLLGDKYVEVTFGSDSAPDIENGSSIEGMPPLDISDLMMKTNDILETTKQTMGKIERGEGTV